ncbi:Bug family tripartite tricarboxylate transporter substrate binding protein [Paucibacter sp. Y2R2-4]|uniref:Bug family tripartite tricarboxylate transporter substrate binding protein n=1 Tax=Paucibacter sp. Y2R2-4 TaxID=2893553 RepID=UPI0021E4682F|nr:tripartite tricarboxylate transporter substrate binding protein [Paucibacter sp. Y2R2-4]MCV2349645.1 tripartite tricarboxylate transporter substrate binding protein [Paucibacter sp. Y2R2-4]
MSQPTPKTFESCTPGRRFALLGLALSTWSFGGFSHAQTEAWPSKPIKWVVAYPAGGGSDFLARQIAPQLGKQLGQTLIIDNRPGAAGIIGSDAVAKAPPDGYTLLSGDNGVMVFNSALYKKLPYAPSDFAPVGLMARFPLILTVNPQSGFSDAKQWLQAVKANPGKYSYASAGIGSPHHLAMEMIKEKTQSFIVHVPYRGTAFAVQDLMSGVVPMAILDCAAGLPQIRAGKLRALAVLSTQRLKQLPEVPTFEELGLKGLEVSAWQGLFLPKSTPEAIVKRMSSEMQKALAQPELKARLEDFGLEVSASDGPALARWIQQETQSWHALIKNRNLSAD